MEINQLISEERVFLDEYVENKDDLFKKVDQKALEMGIINKKGVLYEALLKREEESSTAFDDGFAIPHGKAEGILKPAIFIYRLANKIDWESLDGSNTNVAIILAIPKTEETNTLHLKMISGVARKLIYDDFRNNMKNAKTPKEIIELLQ